MSDESLGFSARVASLFIRSKLTPLIILVSLALGTLAIYTTAREEDPSVTITVADVFVAFPGRGTTDVDERIARPVAAWILEIPSVEHVISSAADDGAMFVVQFRELEGNCLRRRNCLRCRRWRRHLRGGGCRPPEE